MKIQCAHDEIVPLHKLQPNPRNPNKHPAEQIALLSKIIDYQGQRSPIVVSTRSGFIVKGHGRLEAIQKLGWASCAVDMQDYESEAQEFADMIADNKIAELAESDDDLINKIALEMPKDFDLDLLGIPDFVLEPEKGEPGCDEDFVPEVVEAKSKLGDVYELGAHRLICGDSTDKATIDLLMNGEKADMVFTDPPYGMNVDTDYEAMHSSNKAGSRTNRPVIGDDESYDPNPIFAIDAKEVFIWGADYFCQKIPDGGSWVVWDKRLSEEMDKVHGAGFELCWSKQKHKKTICRKLWSGFQGMKKDDGVRVHPTQKPVELVEWFLEKWGKETKNVVDIYGGSGSTLIACEKTNRKCYMMEIDPHYVDVIVSRYCKYANKTKVKLNGIEIDWII